MTIAVVWNGKERVCRHDSSFKAGDGNRAGYPARWRMWNAKTAQMRVYSIDRSDTDSTLNRLIICWLSRCYRKMGYRLCFGTDSGVVVTRFLMRVGQTKILISSHFVVCTHRQTYRQTDTLQCPRILISSHCDCPTLVKKRAP